MLARIATLDRGAWEGAADSSVHEAALERGEVLFLRQRGFEIAAAESRFFSPVLSGAAKNVSFDPVRGQVGGTTLEGDDRHGLADLLARFSRAALTLVRTLLPRYGDHIETGRTSFRPVEIAGRASSWRKDDTRLHIDSFPATPVQGRRILRVFCNVNPEGRPRTWRIGDDFESVARRFAARLRRPLPGTSALLRLLRVTKSHRSSYDALMLQLHDAMKADAGFQADTPQTRFDFPSQSTWIAFTDQVSHAAMAGQYQLEQTLLLPLPAMLDQQRSPLRMLERIVGGRLV